MPTAPDLRTAPHPARRRPPPRWPFALFRAVVAVQALLVFAQAALAGRFLSGDAAALGLHEASGTEVITVVALVQVVAAVLVWRPGGGPGLLVPASIALFLLIVVQIFAGFSTRLAVHVPLGVALLAGLVALALTAPRGGVTAGPPSADPDR